MAQGAHHCQNCDMHGRKGVLATQVYRGYNGETTFACDSCHADALNLLEALRPGGPYRGEVGSKGGGASADLAEYWNGKSGALRKRVYDFVLNHGSAGAEDIARAIGEAADNVSPRCSELTTAKYGFLFTKGPRTAITQMGSRAHVYQLTGARNDQVRETQQRRPRASAFSDPQAGHESQGRDDLRRTARS